MSLTAYLQQSGSVELTSILFSGNSSLCHHTDLRPFTEKAVAELRQNIDRTENLSRLTDLLNQGVSLASFPIIFDRLPQMIFSCTESEDDSNTFIYFLQAIVDQSDDNMNGQLVKVVVKLANAACKVARQVGGASFGLRVLEVLAKSDARNLLVPSINAVHATCLSFVGYPGRVSSYQVAFVYALYLALESPTTWTQSFTQLCTYSAHVLTLMGIYKAAQPSESNSNNNSGGSSHSSGSSSTEQQLPIEAMNQAQRAKGLKKARHLVEIFSSVLSFVRQVLHCGCSSGPVELNITALSSLVSSVLPLALDVSPNDPLNYIENDFGLSKIDLALVISSVKVELIETVISLFEIGHPSMMRYAGILYRPIVALLGSQDFMHVSNTADAVLRSVAVAGRCYPNMTANCFSAGSANCKTIIQLFVSSVDSLTTVPAGKTSSSSVNNKTSSQRWCVLLFEAVESLLLHCAALLPASLRDTIEVYTGKALLCMTKGVLSPHFRDRRGCRISAEHAKSVERLRIDAELQRSVLRVALAEALAPTARPGVLSGNISLLKRACEGCLRSNVTHMQATQCLLTVGALLHPCAIPLPGTASVDLARTYAAAVEANGGTIDATSTRFAENVAAAAAAAAAAVAVGDEGVRSKEAVGSVRLFSEAAAATTGGSADFLSLPGPPLGRSGTAGPIISDVQSPAMKRQCTKPVEDTARFSSSTAATALTKTKTLPPFKMPTSLSSAQSGVNSTHETTTAGGDGSDEDELPDIV